MNVETYSHSEPGWTNQLGFESLLLREWAEAGPLESRLLGIAPSSESFAPDADDGPLAARLRGGLREELAMSRATRVEDALRRRLDERAPERLILTMSDESRQIDRLRLALIEMDAGAFADIDDDNWYVAFPRAA